MATAWGYARIGIFVGSARTAAKSSSIFISSTKEFRRPDDHRSSASELANARSLLRRFVLQEAATAR
jgi:hypothetical protein